MALADRVAVMVEGRIVGLVDRAAADVASIGAWMAGAAPSEIQPKQQDEADHPPQRRLPDHPQGQRRP